jgi:hypothetical protein
LRRLISGFPYAIQLKTFFIPKQSRTVTRIKKVLRHASPTLTAPLSFTRNVFFVLAQRDLGASDKQM